MEFICLIVCFPSAEQSYQWAIPEMWFHKYCGQKPSFWNKRNYATLVRSVVSISFRIHNCNTVIKLKIFINICCFFDCCFRWSVFDTSLPTNATFFKTTFFSNRAWKDMCGLLPLVQGPYYSLGCFQYIPELGYIQISPRFKNVNFQKKEVIF